MAPKKPQQAARRVVVVRKGAMKPGTVVKVTAKGTLPNVKLTPGKPVAVATLNTKTGKLSDVKPPPTKKGPPPEEVPVIIVYDPDMYFDMLGLVPVK